MNNNPVLLEVKGLKKYFPVVKGFLRHTVAHVHAVDGVDLTLRRAQTIGLVGESGCGKTTTGRLILRLIEPMEGSILFHQDDRVTDVRKVDAAGLKEFRRHAQMVFQDPHSSLNPRLTVLNIVGEPLIANGISKGRELRDRVELLLKRVGMPAEVMSHYPHAFSGGQRQRIGIAHALALDPQQLIVADEAVSALDVSIQSRILNLLEDLQAEMQVSYIFVAHNLAVVWHVCDWVCVMYLGKIVESACTEDLYGSPLHPYTEALMAAVPKLDVTHTKKSRALLTGEVPDSTNPPPGCAFHPRCPYATDICRSEIPSLVPSSKDANRLVACHHEDKLSLRGALVGAGL